MGGEEEKSTGELLTLVRLDIRELMTEVKSLKDMSSKIDDTRDRLIKTEDSTSSAHKRLNTHDKIIFWAGTTIIGSVIAGIILFFMRGGAS